MDTESESYATSTMTVSLCHDDHDPDFADQIILMDISKHTNRYDEISKEIQHIDTTDCINGIDSRQDSRENRDIKQSRECRNSNANRIKPCTKYLTYEEKILLENKLNRRVSTVDGQAQGTKDMFHFRFQVDPSTVIHHKSHPTGNTTSFSISTSSSSYESLALCGPVEDPTSSESDTGEESPCTESLEQDDDHEGRKKQRKQDTLEIKQRKQRNQSAQMHKKDSPYHHHKLRNDANRHYYHHHHHHDHHQCCSSAQKAYGSKRIQLIPRKTLKKYKKHQAHMRNETLYRKMSLLGNIKRLKGRQMSPVTKNVNDNNDNNIGNDNKKLNQDKPESEDSFLEQYMKRVGDSRSKTASTPATDPCTNIDRAKDRNITVSTSTPRPGDSVAARLADWHENRPREFELERTYEPSGPTKTIIKGRSRRNSRDIVIGNDKTSVAMKRQSSTKCETIATATLTLPKPVQGILLEPRPRECSRQVRSSQQQQQRQQQYQHQHQQQEEEEQQIPDRTLAVPVINEDSKDSCGRVTIGNVTVERSKKSQWNFKDVFKYFFP